MRITTAAMARNLLRRLDTNNKRILEFQDQLSSGKAVSKPSDDPVAATKAFRLRTTISETARYKANLQEAMDWLTATEEALSKMVDVLQEAREMAVEASTSTLPAGSLDAIAAKIDQFQEHLVTLANSDHGGRFLFAGQNTLTSPFTAAGPVGVLDTGALMREISRGELMKINITGEFLAGPNGILNILPDLAAKVRAGDSDAVSAMISTVEDGIDKVLSLESETGAKINRIQMSIDQMTESEVSLTKLLSETEDADMARLIVDLSREEATYQAALAVGARLIQPTLVDFLR